MKHFRTMFAVSTLLVTLTGCWNFQAQEAPSFVMVNVLDKEFYDDCNIKGSINIPFQDVLAYAQKNWDKDSTEIIVYCSNYQCTASGIVAKELIQNGFKSVYAYEGGTAEWYQAGYSVDGPCLQKYLSFESEPDEEAVHDFPTISLEELKKKVDENADKMG